MKPETKKSERAEAIKAALLSAFVIPGAGQIYNREWGKGIFIALMFLLASLALLIPLTYLALRSIMVDTLMATASNGQVDPILAQIGEHTLTLFTLFLVCTVLYVYSIVDAYSRRMKRKTMNDRSKEEPS